ncbi:MAG: AI-2E family transporter [Alphaproteobacteria bacterium]
MTATGRVWFWVGFAALVLAFLYLFQGVLLPFVVGMAVAYLLDPAADKLESWGCSRTLATTLITAVFFFVVVAALVLILPLLQAQLVDLLARLPDAVAALRDWAEPLVERVRARLPAAEMENLGGTAGDYVGQALGWLGGLVGGLWRGGMVAFNLLTLVLITPLVTFYLLRDWDRIVARVDSWLPRAQAPVIRAQTAKVDATLSGFVRGVFSVCVILAIFYAVGLSLVGLRSGVIIGIVAGLLSFIPFFGALVGAALSVGMALIQFSDWLPIALTAAVFAVGQIAEGNFLTPKLVGGRVGLHPLWIVFALMAGGAVFGFVGVLLAVPRRWRRRISSSPTVTGRRWPGSMPGRAGRGRRSRCMGRRGAARPISPMSGACAAKRSPWRRRRSNPPSPARCSAAGVPVPSSSATRPHCRGRRRKRCSIFTIFSPRRAAICC